MTNFTLQFGKYKGQQFNQIPVSYQNWLLNQDWFKLPLVKEARYDVGKLFTTEYRIGMGMSKEIVFDNLSWEEASTQKDLMNMYHLDDTIQHFYIETSR
jgi:hypothetical protein